MLTRFSLFPQLPPEIREQVFQTAQPSPRVIRIYEIEDFWDSDSNTDASSTSTNTRIVRRALSFPNRGFSSFPRLQRQLEDFSFASSHPQPPLPVLIKLDDFSSNDQAFRTGIFKTSTPPPPLLHTSVQARHALELSGYRRLFGTRTSKPSIYFNPARDCLYLTLSESSSFEAGHGSWNIERISVQDRQLVRYLALHNDQQFELDDSAWTWAVSQFENLEELYVVLYSYETHTCVIPTLHQYSQCVTFPPKLILAEQEDVETVFTPADTFEWKNLRTLFSTWEIYNVVGLWQSYCRSGGIEAEFFSTQSLNFEERIATDRYRRAGAWKVPAVSFVYASTRLGKRQLLAKRELEKVVAPERDKKRREEETEKQRARERREKMEQKERDRVKTDWEIKFADDERVLLEYMLLDEYYGYYYEEDTYSVLDVLGGFGVEY